MHTYILVVEDEPLVAKAVSTTLESEDYVVHRAASIESARNYVQNSLQPISLIVLDLMLPGEDGISGLPKLREDGYEQPILVLTGKQGVDTKVKALDASADDYLLKPFSRKELLARVRALLRRSAPPAKNENFYTEEDAFSVGSIEINPAERVATYDGEDLDLTGREFDILQLLATNIDHSVSRTTILDEVWGNADLQSNTVDVHIKNLRNKLKAKHADVEVETVRGLGYKISEVPGITG